MNILLPERPDDLLAMFERREILARVKSRRDLEKIKAELLKKLLLEKRIEAEGGNAACHRQFSRALSGTKRASTYWRAISSITGYFFQKINIDGPVIQEDEFNFEYEAIHESGPQLKPWAQMVRAFDRQIESARPRLAQAILRLEDEDRRLASLAAAQDTDGFLATLAGCEHAECDTVQNVARHIRSSNVPVDIADFRYPLCVLTILFLVALYMSEDEEWCCAGVSKIMPRIFDGKLVRPMTRWMQYVKEVGEFVTQTEVSYLLGGTCENAKRDGQRLWNGEVATHGQFEKMLSNLKKTGTSSQLDIFSVRMAAKFVPLIENLLSICEEYSSKNPWFSAVDPFYDFEKLQSVASKTECSIAT